MLPEIQLLPKEQWQGYILPIRYAAAAVYDVRIDRTASGYAIGIEKAALDKPVLHTPEDYDFPDCLYAAHWPEARAWGRRAGRQECSPQSKPVRRSGQTGCGSPSCGWMRLTRNAASAMRFWR